MKTAHIPLAQKLGRMLFFLREYFFPFGCALCGASLISASEAWYGLCESCRAAIDAAPGGAERCDLCGRPLVSEQGRCLSCRADEQRFLDKALVLFPYAGKYRRLLAAYKFDKCLALGHFFAEKIAAAAPPNAVVVPAPPRPGKIQKTGWDQVEYLAKLLERRLPLLRCLKRLPSKAQKELNREERRKNLRGRIILKNRLPLPKTAVLIDDVMTTGSTLEVCAEALKAGGVETVYGVCLFYD